MCVNCYIKSRAHHQTFSMNLTPLHVLNRLNHRVIIYVLVTSSYSPYQQSMAKWTQRYVSYKKHAKDGRLIHLKIIKLQNNFPGCSELINFCENVVKFYGMKINRVVLKSWDQHNTLCLCIICINFHANVSYMFLHVLKENKL